MDDLDRGRDERDGACRRRGRRRGPRRLLLAGAACYLGVLAVNRSLIEVRGGSMEPSLWAGDRLLTVPAVRWLLRPGQVVVVRDPSRPGRLATKRLVSLGDAGAVVLGDARDASTDSRTWGPVPLDHLRRVAVARWPDLRTPLRRRAVP